MLIEWTWRDVFSRERTEVDWHGFCPWCSYVLFFLAAVLRIFAAVADSMNMKAIFTPKLWVSSNFLPWEVFALSLGHPYYKGCSKVQWIMTFGLDLNLYLPNLCVHFLCYKFLFLSVSCWSSISRQVHCTVEETHAFVFDIEASLTPWKNYTMIFGYCFQY